MVLIVMAHKSGGSHAREVLEEGLEEGRASEAFLDAVVDSVLLMSASQRS